MESLSQVDKRINQVKSSQFEITEGKMTSSERRPGRGVEGICFGGSFCLVLSGLGFGDNIP